MATSLTDMESDSTSKKVLELPGSIISSNLHGLSRSPTPSDSSESDCDSLEEEGSDTEIEDSYDIGETMNGGISGKQAVNYTSRSADESVVGIEQNRYEIKYKSESCFAKSERICAEAKIAMQTGRKGKQTMINSSKVKGEDEAGMDIERAKYEIKYKSDSYLAKSERICNEAKIAMQTKIVSAKINDLCADSPNGLKANTDVKCMLDGKVKSEPLDEAMFGPEQAGPFDPGPENHTEKLAYLQNLQAQLGVLKQKQKVLKEQEMIEKCVDNQGNHCKVGLEVDVAFANDVHEAQEFDEPQLSTCDRIALETEISNSWLSIEQKTREKSENEKKKYKSSWEYAELEHHVQTRHQNEQLRLHQHFLIREQMLAHTVESQARKDELLKQFVQQQQLLMDQQKVQLQDMRQRYLKELQDIKASMSQNMSDIMIENNRIIENKKKLNHYPPLLSPTGTDHSITSILNHADQNASVDVKPVLEKDGKVSIICDTCQFLKDYGVVKRKCLKCQNLRVKYGIAQPETLAPATSVATATYSNNLDNVVEKLSKRCKSEAECESTVISLSEQVSVSTQSIDQNPSIPLTLSTSIKSEPISQDCPRVMIVSNSCPTIPDLSVKAETASSSSTVSSKLVCESSKSSSSSSGVISNSSSSSSSSSSTVTFTLSEPENADTCDVVDLVNDIEECVNENLKTEMPDDNEMSDISRVANRNSFIAKKVGLRRSTEKLISCQKPTRSYSQSEIYGKIAADAEEVVETGSRFIRSLSQSEATGAQQSDLELTPTKSDDNLDASSSGKKRKAAVNRCLSVPGWFGKGLNIRKKRR